MVTNMIVELSASFLESSNEAAVLSKTGASLVKRQGASAEEVGWIRRTFNSLWGREASEGWNWFAKSGDGRTVGFACFEQRTLRFWWIKRWLAKTDVGIFGPLGVDPSVRGHGLGCLLVHRALGSLRELGYSRAVIPRVGSEAFYERCCGARVVERLKLLGIF